MMLNRKKMKKRFFHHAILSGRRTKGNEFGALKNQAVFKETGSEYLVSFFSPDVQNDVHASKTPALHSLIPMLKLTMVTWTILT